MFGCEAIMATRYGRTFTTRRGRRGRYKYVNGRKVSFVATTSRSRKPRGFRESKIPSIRRSERRRNYYRRY